MVQLRSTFFTKGDRNLRPGWWLLLNFNPICVNFQHCSANWSCLIMPKCHDQIQSSLLHHVLHLPGFLQSVFLFIMEMLSEVDAFSSFDHESLFVTTWTMLPINKFDLVIKVMSPKVNRQSLSQRKSHKFQPKLCFKSKGFKTNDWLKECHLTSMMHTHLVRKAHILTTKTVLKIK